MRTIVINTGTELLLGDVLNTHLGFVAREVFAFGLRVDEQRTVPDGEAIQRALAEVFPRAEIVFLTGGLGPTSDDVTRDLVAALLDLELAENAQVRETIANRLARRRILTTKAIWRQALVPRGARILPNDNGTAPGIYCAANINPRVPSPHLILLPGPPRELQPMFRDSVVPLLHEIVDSPTQTAMQKFRIAIMGESIVEEKIGATLLAIPGIELGYCARPGEVDVRIIGPPQSIAKASELIRVELGDAIFTSEDEELSGVIVRLLGARAESLALAESCTGGFLANKITNIAGASKVFLGGYVTYSNEEKIRVLGLTSQVIDEFGAVSEQVAIEMATRTRERTGATHAIATTGIAGPDGGTTNKPVGTVFVAIASENQETRSEKFFFPTDRETFKELVAQNAFDLLRRRLL